MIPQPMTDELWSFDGLTFINAKAKNGVFAVVSIETENYVLE